MRINSFLVDGRAGGKRLDVFLCGSNPELSRSHLQKLIADGKVLVNGRSAKSSYRIQQGEKVEMELPEPVEIALRPEALRLPIVYEDGDVIVVNKPQGMVVHPAAGNMEGTLVNALLYHCSDLSGINGKLRPGIVHRIDKDTSGLLVAAKNDFSHRQLAAQLKEHSMKRVYTLLVYGNVAEDSGVIDAPIGRRSGDRKKMGIVEDGKNAITHYRVLERFGGYTLLEALLETGRTHQIRVHLAYLGHPLAGDPKYGPQKEKLGLKGQALHAGVLGFVHPRSKKYLEFTAPLPESFCKVLKKLRIKSNSS